MGLSVTSGIEAIEVMISESNYQVTLRKDQFTSYHTWQDTIDYYDNKVQELK